MKKLFSLLLVFVFTIGIVSPALTNEVYASGAVMTVNGTTHTDYDRAWAEAITLANDGFETTVVLKADWNAPNGNFSYSMGTDSGRLCLSDSDVNMTIDLNGYTINRGLTTTKDDGHVFKLTNGKLTITDSVGTGKITGANNDGYGGAFYVTERATLTLNGGKISGNNGDYGGGVYVCNAMFYMNGGTIENNTAEYGGGVALDHKYNADREYLVFKGGKISANNARVGGGVYMSSNREDAVVTFENTEITENFATDAGGGVYVGFNTEYANVYFGKGTRITKNTSNKGGGVYASCGGYSIVDATITENRAYTRCGGVAVEDDMDDNSHGNIWEYGVYTLGGSAYVQGNYVQANSSGAKKIPSNLRIGDGTCDLYYDAENPFTKDASIGIDMFSDFGRQEDNDKITDDKGNFAIDSFKYFTVDNPDLVIKPKDSGESSGTNKYQLYVEFADKTADGAFKYATLKKVFRTEIDPAVDWENKIITFTVNPSSKKCLENCSLYGLADYYCGADWSSILGGDKIMDLSVVNDSTWQFMAKDKSYELWQIKIVPYGGKWIEGEACAAKVTANGITKYYADFESAWADAIESYKTTDTVFTLNMDWYAGDSDSDGNIDPGKTAGVFKVTKNGSECGTDNGRLYLDNDDYTLTIDLNGHTLSRNLKTAVEHGQVFRIASGAKLIIIDTSAQANGKITGGNNTGNGGGFYIDYGRVYLKGGEITGNKATNGGGIYGTNTNDTFVYMLGGKISNNTASQNGGGVFMYNGSFYVEDGEITGNVANNGGGIYWESRDIFCLTNGTISNNMADKGAGVYATDWGDMYIGGTIVVKDNIFKNGSGKSNFYLEDNDAYLNNAAGQNDEVPNKPLSVGAYIGISGGDTDYCVSDSDSRFDKYCIKYIHSDDDSRVVRGVYDEDSKNHTYKVYLNDVNNSKVKVPRIKTVEEGSWYLVNEITFDYENQSIFITSDITLKGRQELVNNSLSRITKITFEHDGIQFIGYDEKRNLTEPQEYILMMEDGSYNIFTTSLEWECPCIYRDDINVDGICDLCGKYIFRVIDYNAQTKEATVVARTAGEYALVFAAYDAKGLENVEVVEYNFKEGINVVPQKKDFELHSGDRIMLWQDMIKYTPLCDALALK